MVTEGFVMAAPMGLLAVLAALPILAFLLGLTWLRLKGIHAALLTLGLTLVLALGVFSLPKTAALAAVVQGLWQGVWPIGYIIVMAVWLYKLVRASGQFEIIKGSLMMVSADARIQLLLIAYCFGAFLEGAAGFGVPIAICSVMLVALGFAPLQAAMLCLIANAASGAFGAVGIPVAIIDSFHLDGVSSMDVSRTTNTTLPWVAGVVPFLLVALVDGWRGIRETWPALLLCAAVFMLGQMAVTYFMGPELADIVPPLLALLALALLCLGWQPARIVRLEAGEARSVRYRLAEILWAWLPFLLLSVLVIVWSLPGFHALFQAGGALAFSQGHWLLWQGAGQSISLDISLIGATGTAILLTVLGSGLLVRKHLPAGQMRRDLQASLRELWLPITTIGCILAIAKLTTYAGMTEVLGQAVAVTGQAFPLLAPVLGWVGVFMTGSVVNSNTLFAPVQVAVAEQLNLPPALLVEANTVGGTMAKLVSPQSITIATAAVGCAGQESSLLKMTLRYSLALLAFVCLWTGWLAWRG